jgi:selenocysteine-specific elongation factor
VELSVLASELRVDADRLRAAVEDGTDLVVERGYVRGTDHRSRVAESADARALLDVLDGAPFSPPDPASSGADPALVRSLVREGALVDLDGIVFTSDALDEARRRIQTALSKRGTVTVADVRDLLGSTRKYVLPILKQLDAEGVTRRRGDDRIPGPATLRTPG